MENKIIEELNSCNIKCGDCKYYRSEKIGYDWCLPRLPKDGDVYMKPKLFIPSSGFSFNRFICCEFEPKENYKWLKSIWNEYGKFYKIDWFEKHEFLVIGKKSDNIRWYRINVVDFMQGFMDKLTPYYKKERNGYQKWYKENCGVENEN